MTTQQRQTPNYKMTLCGKTGIRIHESSNDYKTNPFQHITKTHVHEKELSKMFRPSSSTNPSTIQPSSETFDFNIHNYSIQDIYQLFGLDFKQPLSEQDMKSAKKIVLKLHPDKSRLEDTYFLFFKKAYDKLNDVYSFQNQFENSKSKSPIQYTNNDVIQEDHGVLPKEALLKKLQTFKNNHDFNHWFNETFEKTNIKDEQTENGYGDWLKSNEDITYITSSQDKNKIINDKKQQLKQLIHYNGVEDSIAEFSAGGYSLMEFDNYTSSHLVGGNNMAYTDLKQAYIETVVPVTEEDYHKMKKFNSVDEYKRHRENMTFTRECTFQDLKQQTMGRDEYSPAEAYQQFLEMETLRGRRT